jgi:prepilin signal peptidase PulO-like enzyme (type II secretory pathway)
MKLTPSEYALIGVVLVLTNLVTLFSYFAFAATSVLFEANWLLSGAAIAPLSYLIYGLCYVNKNILAAGVEATRDK